MMIRAGASNREMVQSLGLNINLVYRLVFALGVALAAFAGMIAAPVSSVYPGMGTGVLIICFVVVVIGGIGSIWGALVAALLIGLADTFGKVLIPGSRVRMTTYPLMAAILLARRRACSGNAPDASCPPRTERQAHRLLAVLVVVAFAATYYTQLVTKMMIMAISAFSSTCWSASPAWCAWDTRRSTASGLRARFAAPPIPGGESVAVTPMAMACSAHGAGHRRAGGADDGIYSSW